MRQLHQPLGFGVATENTSDGVAAFPFAIGPRGAVPGFSFAVVDLAGLHRAGGAGLADLGSSTPATPQTIYPWYSMTKLVTATAILQLAERGALDLDAPVTRHYPLFRDLQPAAWAASVTIRNLLNHSAGLANPLPLRWVHRADTSGPEPASFIANLLARHPRLHAAPGTRAAYSNLGYLVLGEIVAAVAAQPYQDYVRAHILAPLGMHRTDFTYPEATEAPVATGYQRRWHALTPLLRALLPPGILASPVGRFVAFHRFYVDGAAYGGLVGPVDDAARFLQAQLAAGQGRANALLAPESAAQMQRINQRGAGRDFGLGWFQPQARRAGAAPFIEHLGGGAGFWNDMRLYPTLGLGFVVMGNATSYDHDAIVQTLVAHEATRL